MASKGSMCVRTLTQFSRLFRQSIYQRDSLSRIQSGRYCTTTKSDINPKGKDTEARSQEEVKKAETASQEKVEKAESRSQENVEKAKARSQENVEKAEARSQENVDKAAKKDTKTAKAKVDTKAIQDKLEKEAKEFKEKYLRALAETENVRLRMTKQNSDIKLFGIQGFCKDLLEVADILQAATKSVPQDQIEENPPLKTLFEGVAMTEVQLQKVFNKHGLEQIKPEKGEPFDPNLHEALFQVPTEDSSMSQNVAVLEKLGYKLHSRTLRPAQVGVFK